MAQMNEIAKRKKLIKNSLLVAAEVVRMLCEGKKRVFDIGKMFQGFRIISEKGEEISNRTTRGRCQLQGNTKKHVSPPIINNTLLVQTFKAVAENHVPFLPV